MRGWQTIRSLVTDGHAMRRLFTKRQFFLLFNLVSVIAVYFWGNFRFTIKDFTTLAIVLVVINVLSIYPAGKYKDWKT